MISNGRRMYRLPRRRFLMVAAALFVAPATAQKSRAPKVPRIGYLMFNSAATGRDVFDAFRERMRQLGWIDGKNVVVEARFAEGEVDRLPLLANELLTLEVDLIVAGSSAATRASKSATKTVPIVMLASADAVGEGLVASLAHPGGNITGMTFLAGPEIASKQFELLREIIPTASRVAVLMNPRNASHAAFVAELKTAERKHNARLQPVRAAAPTELDGAFATMANNRAHAMLVLTDAMFLGERRRIVELARVGAVPAMYSQREFVDAGGLVSYGPSLADMARRAAAHVDKILRGAKPDDVPVEQPTTFELVINSSAVRQLGVTIPQSLRLRAEFIE